MDALDTNMLGMSSITCSMMDVVFLSDANASFFCEIHACTIIIAFSATVMDAKEENTLIDSNVSNIYIYLQSVELRRAVNVYN